MRKSQLAGKPKTSEVKRNAQNDILTGSLRMLGGINVPIPAPAPQGPVSGAQFSSPTNALGTSRKKAKPITKTVNDFSRGTAYDLNDQDQVETQTQQKQRPGATYTRPDQDTSGSTLSNVPTLESIMAGYDRAKYGRVTSGQPVDAKYDAERAAFRKRAAKQLFDQGNGGIENQDADWLLQQAGGYGSSFDGNAGLDQFINNNTLRRVGNYFRSQRDEDKTQKLLMEDTPFGELPSAPKDGNWLQWGSQALSGMGANLAGGVEMAAGAGARTLGLDRVARVNPLTGEPVGMADKDLQAAGGFVGGIAALPATAGAEALNMAGGSKTRDERMGAGLNLAAILGPTAYMKARGKGKSKATILDPDDPRYMKGSVKGKQGELPAGPDYIDTFGMDLPDGALGNGMKQLPGRGPGKGTLSKVENAYSTPEQAGNPVAAQEGVGLLRTPEVTANEPWGTQRSSYLSPGYHVTQTDKALRAEINKWQKLADQGANTRKFALDAAEKLKRSVEHRKAVEQAIAEGKPVPAEVLKDYPDLAPNLTVKESGVVRRGKVQYDQATRSVIPVRDAGDKAYQALLDKAAKLTEEANTLEKNLPERKGLAGELRRQKLASLTPLPKEVKWESAKPEYPGTGNGLATEKVFRAKNIDPRTTQSLSADYIGLIPGESQKVVAIKDGKITRVLAEGNLSRADIIESLRKPQTTNPPAEPVAKAEPVAPKAKTPAKEGGKPQQKEPWEMTAKGFADGERNAVYDALDAQPQPRETHVAVDLSTGKEYTHVNGKLNTIPAPGRVIPATPAEIRAFDNAVSEGMVQVERRVITGAGMTTAMTVKRGDKAGNVTRSRGMTPEASHKLEVQKALSEGKPVPVEVLADYPDLAPKAKSPAPVQTPEQSADPIIREAHKADDVTWDKATEAEFRAGPRDRYGLTQKQKDFLIGKINERLDPIEAAGKSMGHPDGGIGVWLKQKHGTQLIKSAVEEAEHTGAIPKEITFTVAVPGDGSFRMTHAFADEIRTKVGGAPIINKTKNQPRLTPEQLKAASEQTGSFRIGNTPQPETNDFTKPVSGKGVKPDPVRDYLVNYKFNEALGDKSGFAGMSVLEENAIKALEPRLGSLETRLMNEGKELASIYRQRKSKAQQAELEVQRQRVTALETEVQGMRKAARTKLEGMLKEGYPVAPKPTGNRNGAPKQRTAKRTKQSGAIDFSIDPESPAGKLGKVAKGAWNAVIDLVGSPLSSVDPITGKTMFKGSYERGYGSHGADASKAFNRADLNARTNTGIFTSELDKITAKLQQYVTTTKKTLAQVEAEFVDLIEKQRNDPSRITQIQPLNDALKLHDKLTEQMRQYIIKENGRRGKNLAGDWGVTDKGFYTHIFDEGEMELPTEVFEKVKIGREMFRRYEKSRTGAEGYKKDYGSTMEMYVANVVKTQELSTLSKSLKDIVEAMPEGASRTKLKGLLDSHLSDLRGHIVQPGEVIISNALAQHGVDPYAFRKFINEAVGLTSALRLKWSPRATVANKVQPLQTLLPLTGGVDYAAALKYASTDELKNMMRRRGALESMATADVMTGANKTYARAGLKHIKEQGVFGIASERNRAIGYAYGVLRAEKAGFARTSKEAHESGAFWANMTEFNNSKYNQSPLFRSVAAKPFTMYKGFGVKNMENLYIQMKNNPRGNGKGVAARGALQVLLGGSKSLPMGALLAVGAYTMARNMGADEKTAHGMAEKVAFGLPGMVGVDMSTSFDLFNVGFGKSPKEQIGSFAVGPMLGTGIDLVGKALDTKKQSAGERAWNIASAATPYAKQVRAAVDSATKGGATLSTKAKAGKADSAAKIGGFQTVTESEHYEPIMGKKKGARPDRPSRPERPERPKR